MARQGGLGDARKPSTARRLPAPFSCGLTLTCEGLHMAYTCFSDIVDQFERLPPHPPITFALWVHSHGGRAPTFLNGALPSMRVIAIPLPGELFGLSFKEDIPAVVAITPSPSAEFSAVSEIAGRLARGAYPHGRDAIDNGAFWVAAFVRESLLAPGEFLRPESGLFVLSHSGVAVHRHIVFAYRDGRFELTNGVLSQNDIKPPWTLQFTVTSINLASAELCRRLAKHKGEECALVEAREETPQFTFRKHGDGWFIRAFGKEGHFKDRVGFAYLSVLLATPGVAVAMTELIATAKGPPRDLKQIPPTESWQPVLDGQAKRSLKNRLVELNAEIERAEKQGNGVYAEVLRREFHEVAGRLRADTTRTGRPRQFARSVDKMRSQITNAIRRAYQALYDHNMRELADHLKVCISCQGNAFIYSPPQPLRWSTS